MLIFQKAFMGLKLVTHWPLSLKIKKTPSLVYPLLYTPKRDQLGNCSVIFRILYFLNLLIIVHFSVFEGFLSSEPYFCSLFKVLYSAKAANSSCHRVCSPCDKFFIFIPFAVVL